MEYTLFVDESGHFGHDDTPSEDWVVGGVLFPSAPTTAEKSAGNRLNPIPSQYGLDGRGDLHRTELNKRALSSSSAWDFQRIGALTQSLFGAVRKASKEAQFVAVRNPSQRRLSDPEETYRLMLVDLIALADSVLPPDEAIDRLHLCVASRTNREGRMTTRTELGERLRSVVGAVEVDLASRGAAGLLRQENVGLRQQTNSWLLTVSDFWCNAVYNQDRPESKQVVDTLLNQGGGRVFTSWSDDVRVRRALVAERDGNYGLALYRWASLGLEANDTTPRTDALNRLCRQLASTPRSPRPTFEQAIEMIWRRFGKKERYGAVLTALRSLEEAVESVADDLPSADALLFRLRNMRHLAANRDGRTETALSIGETQKGAASHIGYDPENFSLILNSQLHRIHTLHHALDFDAGLNESQKHRDRVQTYGTLWDLLEEDRGDPEHDDEARKGSFEASRMSLKAEMTWIESRIRAAAPDASLDEVLTRIEDLKDLPMADYDRSRLLNYSILARLKRGWWAGVLDESRHALSQSTDQYTLAHAARAAATSTLVDATSHQKNVQAIVEAVREHMGKIQGVFPGLTRRDVALLTSLLDDDPSAARTALREGRTALTWSPSDHTTPIRQWVSWTFELTGQFLSKGGDMDVEVPASFQDTLLDVNRLYGREGLVSARRVGPY